MPDFDADKCPWSHHSLPAALALVFANGALFSGYVVQRIGVIDNAPFANHVAWVGFVSAVVIVAGLVTKWAIVREFGFLLSFGTWSAMVYLYVGRFGFGSTATTLGVAWAVLSGGSWLQERFCTRVRGRGDG